MELDDDLCLCFHVSRRKVINFVRVEKPQRLSQMANCFGAGTGCGWCRPFLERIYNEVRNPSPISNAECEDDSAVNVPQDLPDRDEYAKLRAQYVKEGKGTPPTPLS